MFYHIPINDEALQGLGGKRGIYFRETGNKDQMLRGTGEQKQNWGTGNITKYFFLFWEQGNKPINWGGQGNKPVRAEMIQGLNCLFSGHMIQNFESSN